MKRLTPSAVWIATVTLAACAAMAAFAHDATSHAHTQAHVHSSAASSPYDLFQKEMNAGMAHMMEKMHGDGYTGNVDVDFLAMMIPHHAGAVDMARLELQHGTDPATRQLAQDIIAGQTVEIESMGRRLEMIKRKGGAGEEFPALTGTRGP